MILIQGSPKLAVLVGPEQLRFLVKGTGICCKIHKFTAANGVEYPAIFVVPEGATGRVLVFGGHTEGTPTEEHAALLGSALKISIPIVHLLPFALAMGAGAFSVDDMTASQVIHVALVPVPQCGEDVVAAVGLVRDIDATGLMLASKYPASMAYVDSSAVKRAVESN